MGARGYRNEADSETRATVKGASIVGIDPLGTYATVSIPGVGTRRIHQSGVHEDSEVYWRVVNGKRVEGNDGPAKLVLNGWYAERIGLELD